MADVPDIFAEVKLRHKQLLEQLAASPAVDVFGVVSLSGASGDKLRGDTLWTLRFTLEAWRIDTGNIQTRPLTIQRAVTDQELKRYQDQIKPYTVIRVSARVVADSLLGSPQGLLEALARIDASDAELNDYAVQLQEPVIHKDPVLGTFTLDRRVNWFSGDVVWNGNPIPLQLSARDPAEVQEALKSAYSLWESQDAWNRRIRDYAAQELLPLKNRNWLGENEAELSADQFKDRMTLEAIAVAPGGSFDFWHNDGDLFGGHTIQISGNLTEGPTDADIPG
jgi:hypothetical protein